MNTQIKTKKLIQTLLGILMPVFLSLPLPGISFAQISDSSDQTVRASTIITSDPFFTTESSDTSKQWYLSKINISNAWDDSKGSEEVIVAIVDTGIHASHVELRDGRVIAGYNSITSEEIKANTDSDDNGHGTAVAGIIGAIPDNGRGIAGINWKVKLMPIKALAADGTGNLRDVAKGIMWAADHGASIINLSLGGNGFTLGKTLSDAIAFAYNRGVLIVAAAGNDQADEGSNLDSAPVYPICADNDRNMILGVAATDTNDHKADFSNFGHNCVDISAPGKRILTTAFEPADPSNNVLVYGSGTSVAAPIVSGVAALIKAAHPNYLNLDLQRILLNATDNIDSLNQTQCSGTSCNGFLGTGRINAQLALSPTAILNGTLVLQANTGRFYLIEGGTKHYVSPYVYSQKFGDYQIVNEIASQLDGYRDGDAIAPPEGTLIKGQTQPAVYLIDQGKKRNISFKVFHSWGFNFGSVKSLPNGDVAMLSDGSPLWPPDGAAMMTDRSPQVYVMDDQVRKPVTLFVFKQRQLSFAKIIHFSLDEFLRLPKPNNASWLPPLDGTLVKSDIRPEVYLIEQGAKRLLSYQAFISRNLRFSDIIVLPQIEMDIIALGSKIIQ